MYWCTSGGFRGMLTNTVYQIIISSATLMLEYHWANIVHVPAYLDILCHSITSENSYICFLKKTCCPVNIIFRQYGVSWILFPPQTSSDYESMTPGVRTEPEFHCSCSVPNYNDLPALPPPPADSCRRFTSNHRDSEISLSLSDYADVDVPGHICPYQHLDLSQLEEHVYYSLQGNISPKLGPAKEHIHSWFEKYYFISYCVIW